MDKTLENVTIHESRQLVVEDVSDDGTFEVLLIDEGKGSSGIYNRELFEKSHHAFDDALSFKNHPSGWDGPESRDFTMISGEIVGETYVKENPKTGKAGIYGRYRPDPEYADKIERYKNKLGLSIYADAEGYFDEDGEFVVDHFNEHWPYTSVDIVIAAGRGGKLSAESLRKMYPESTRPGEYKKENTMKPEEVFEALASLTTAVQALVSKTEAEQAEGAQREADEKAVEEALAAYDARIAAIAEADLLPAQAKGLRAKALAGEDVTEAIAEAVALRKEMEEALAESQGSTGGRVVEGATTSKFGAWA